MLDETVALLPVLQSPDADRLLRGEIESNNLLQLGKTKTRLRMMTEFKRRYAAMPPSFWKWFLALDRAGQVIALYYCLMCTYQENTHEQSVEWEKGIGDCVLFNLVKITKCP